MANNISLLQHQIGKFGVVTVMDAVLFEYGTVKPVLKMDTLKVSSITVDGSTKEIRGGATADLLLTYNYGRSVSVEITDALLSLYSLSTLWGTNVGSLDGKLYKTTITKEAVTEGTDPFSAIFFKEDGSAGALGTDYFVTDSNGNEVSKAGDFKKGLNYVGYGYAKGAAGTDVNPVEVVLKGGNFPSALTLVGKTTFIDEKTGKNIISEIEIPKFVFGNSFDFSMDAEGDSASFNFNGTALADGSDKELIKIRTLSIQDASGSGEDSAWKNK